MSVGANIKKRRYELKMSQQELAEKMGYKTRSTIAKIESGENDVSQKKLVRFAEILETSVETLILGYSAELDFKAAERIDADGVKNIAVILAGGKSGRNSQNIPSQFIEVKGKPIIVYSLEAFERHPSIDSIYVVCLKGWESIVKAYAGKYAITKLKGIVPAGNSGIRSLKNAVDYIRRNYSPDDRVFIQEATRPQVTTEIISRLLGACLEKDSATICHYMNDYVQFNVSSGKAKYLDRNSLVALQSPEVHKLSRLCEVFDRAHIRGHELNETCLTMLLYNLGYEINFIESSINNIKISREEDIATLAALLKE